MRGDQVRAGIAVADVIANAADLGGSLELFAIGTRARVVRKAQDRQRDEHRHRAKRRSAKTGREVHGNCRRDRGWRATTSRSKRHATKISARGSSRRKARLIHRKILSFDRFCYSMISSLAPSASASYNTAA